MRGPATGTTRPRVLVVDDERVIREILADFLTLEGFDVRTAGDGQSALLELSRGHYDLVLSDLKMPNMGGLELLRAIQDHAPDVVVVIMTGFGTVETAIGAMKAGAYDYILKPFKVEEVIHTIRRGLEKRRLMAENLRLREAVSLYKVSEAITASLSLDEVLGAVVESVLRELQSDRVMVYLDDGEGGLFTRADRRSEEGVPTHRSLLDLKPESLASHLQDSFFARLQGAAILPLCNHDGAQDQGPPDDTQVVRPESLLAVALRIRGEVRGYLCALSYTTGRLFDEGQRKLLTIIANRAAASIENANLYEDLKGTFHQTIRGLASAIDKMDRYTAGHSERVASYAQMLAERLGMSENEMEIVRQSALMHDVGKIGCVMNLNKPGKLSQEEYEIFKKHPGYGKDILEPITFLHPLIPGVHLHHERFDGHGYPLGLKGKNIPLMARIISVADTYDAMTSDRAYRRALPHGVAVSEVKRCVGSQFDPSIAGEFIEMLAHEEKERAKSGLPFPLYLRD